MVFDDYWFGDVVTEEVFNFRMSLASFIQQVLNEHLLLSVQCDNPKRFALACEFRIGKSLYGFLNDGFCLIVASPRGTSNKETDYRRELKIISIEIDDSERAALQNEISYLENRQDEA